MTRRRKKKKRLDQWIEERKSFDKSFDECQFLGFCEQEGYYATDMVSEDDFLNLEEKFGA